MLFALLYLLLRRVVRLIAGSSNAVASGDFGGLADRMPVLCAYALKLALSPWEMCDEDLGPLRRAGMSDRDIVDANQVVAYFSYVNHVADGLGVELESYWPDEVRARKTYPLRGRLG